MHIVRNPYEIYLSTEKLFVDLCNDQGLQEPDFLDPAQRGPLREFILRVFENMHSRLFSGGGPVGYLRELMESRPRRYAKLRYEEIDSTRNDPEEVVKVLHGTYSDLGIDLDASVCQKMRADLQARAQRKKYAKNRHRDLTRDEARRIRAAWRGYFETHGYSDDAEMYLGNPQPASQK